MDKQRKCRWDTERPTVHSMMAVCLPLPLALCICRYVDSILFHLLDIPVHACSLFNHSPVDGHLSYKNKCLEVELLCYGHEMLSPDKPCPLKNLSRFAQVPLLPHHSGAPTVLKKKSLPEKRHVLPYGGYHLHPFWSSLSSFSGSLIIVGIQVCLSTGAVGSMKVYVPDCVAQR